MQVRMAETAYVPRTVRKRARARSWTETGAGQRLAGSDAAHLAQSIAGGMLGGGISFVLLAMVFGAWWA